MGLSQDAMRDCNMCGEIAMRNRYSNFEANFASLPSLFEKGRTLSATSRKNRLSRSHEPDGPKMRIPLHPESGMGYDCSDCVDTRWLSIIENIGGWL